jgi:phage major head subunit gpT-like protein
MAITVLPNMILKGALAAFWQKMDQIPKVWDKHVMNVTSTTATEKYTWPGMIPIPRVFEDARSIQGFRDFQFDLPNNKYELTLLIKRDDFEDDQNGSIMMRFLELAEVFGTFKDQLFAALLVAGGTDVAPMDGTSFFDDTRTIGDSGTIDNDLTSAAATDTQPTSAEVLSVLNLIQNAFHGFNDDQGRPFNSLAVTDMRMIIPPVYWQPVTEALNASFISQTDNVFKGMAQFDVLPYLTGADTMYVSALGATRKPFIFQERTKLEVIIDTDPAHVAAREGVLVMCRERFRLGYGEVRRCIRQVYT